MRASVSVCCSLLAVALATPVLAKLPALTEEGKAKAAEAAAKTAWTDQVGLYKVCMAMDRVADHYRRTAKSASAPTATPPCTEPGPFTPPVTPVTAVKDKPIEASEAHSPSGMAVSPPSTNATASQLNGSSKK